jgi:translation initiation factor IF-2
MTDDRGHSIKKAGPSTPVEILGLPEVPEAGEIFYAISDEKVAKHLVEREKTNSGNSSLKQVQRYHWMICLRKLRKVRLKN